MKRIRRILRWIRVSKPVRLALLLLVLLGSVVGFVWGTDVARVRAIIVEGNEVLTEEEIRAIAEETAQAPMLGPLFPGNVIAFSGSRIEAALSAVFPRIATVEAGRDIIKGHITIVVSERTTASIWCAAHVKTPEPQIVQEKESAEGEEKEEKSQEPPPLLGEFDPVVVDACFLMDKDGVAFADAPETEGSLILTLVDAKGGEVLFGDIAVDEQTMRGIRTIWDAFRNEISVRGRRVLMRPEGIITIETFEGWEALFSTEHPLEGQMVALRELLVQELDPAARASIDVIDLRIPGRIYYR